MRNAFAISAIVLLAGRTAFALDASELASLRETVHDICVSPDRMGDYVQTEGAVKVGVPVLFKLVNADLSGHLAYDQWQGISMKADQYKTDPRQCAIEVLKILKPAVSSPDGVSGQHTEGAGSPIQSGNGNSATYNGPVGR